MKKLLTILLASAAVVAMATNPAPSSKSKFLPAWMGTFNPLSTYKQSGIFNTYYTASPTVIESATTPTSNAGVTYIMNGESGTTAPIGILPESAPTYWDKY